MIPIIEDKSTTLLDEFEPRSTFHAFLSRHVAFEKHVNRKLTSILGWFVLKKAMEVKFRDLGFWLELHLKQPCFFLSVCLAVTM